MKTKSRRFKGPLANVFASLALTLSAHAVDFVVAPDGRDENPGTEGQPFATIAKARDAVRVLTKAGMTRDVVVLIRAGDYILDAPVVFGPQDSGTDGFRVIYRNADALGSARFIGGRVLRGRWTADEDSVYRIEIGTDSVPHTLYVDGVRMQKARHPNRVHDESFPSAAAPYLVTTSGETVGSKGGHFNATSNPTWVGYKEGDLDPVRLDLSQLRINTFPWGKADWHRMLCKVTRIDPETRRIYFDNLDQKVPQKDKQRYFLEDDRSFLDAAGEFFFDEKTGRLYLVPHDGKTPNGREVVVPTTTTLITVIGEDQQPVRNIRFEGLQFYGTNLDSPAPYLFPDPPYRDATMDRKAMVYLEHSEGVEVLYCHFFNGGRSAFSAHESTHMTVYGNWMQHMGMSGILISSSEMSLLSNNRIHDIGYLQLYAQCIGLFKTSNIEVSHCELYNSARYAVTVRGHVKEQYKEGYIPGAMGSFNNRFHHLKIHGVSQDSGDTGGLHSATINHRYDPFYNFFDQITITRSWAVPGMNDHKPNGIFLDWPGAAQHQQFSNIEIKKSQGKPFRTNRNDGASVLDNVSWLPGFDKTKMEYDQIGFKPDFPKEYGGQGKASTLPPMPKRSGAAFAHYRLDSNLDDLQHLSTASQAGDPTFSSEVKRAGTHALRFDGELDLMTLATDLRRDFTISLWARYEPQTAGGSVWRPILYSGSDFDKGAIVISTQRDGAGAPGTLHMGIDSRQGFDVGFDDRRWHFLTLTRSADSWKAYHNGKLLGSGTIDAFVPDSMCLQIGGDRDSLERKDQWRRHFRGYVDDVRTFAVALGEVDVRALYESY